MGSSGYTGSSSGNKTTVKGGDGNDLLFVANCQIYCFHCDSMIKVLEKGILINKKISQIKKGDQVLTYNGKMKIFSKVTKNLKNEGLFEFYTIKCKDSKSNIKSISVTGNHTMIIYGKKMDEIKFKYANQVKIGDQFLTTDGLFEVYEIKNEMIYGSYEMRVENGTVLANDILVSTLYLEKNEVRKYNKKKSNCIRKKIEILN